MNKVLNLLVYVIKLGPFLTWKFVYVAWEADGGSLVHGDGLGVGSEVWVYGDLLLLPSVVIGLVPTVVKAILVILVVVQVVILHCTLGLWFP